MAAAPPSDQLGALKWFAPPLLHVHPAPAQTFPDLKTSLAPKEAQQIHGGSRSSIHLIAQCPLVLAT